LGNLDVLSLIRSFGYTGIDSSFIYNFLGTTMKAIQKSIKKFAIGTALIVAMLFAQFFSTHSTQPVQAATQLGGVNLVQYCQDAYPNDKEAALVQKGTDAYAWHCRASVLGLFKWDHKISMGDACRTQFGTGAYETTTDSKDAFAWTCNK
jgi:hypothetical protein